MPARSPLCRQATWGVSNRRKHDRKTARRRPAIRARLHGGARKHRPVVPGVDNVAEGREGGNGPGRPVGHLHRALGAHLLRPRQRPAQLREVTDGSWPTPPPPPTPPPRRAAGPPPSPRLPTSPPTSPP